MTFEFKHPNYYKKLYSGNNKTNIKSKNNNSNNSKASNTKSNTTSSTANKKTAQFFKG